ncbi:hypothetical protein EHQ27_07005 [Leptospira wolffii]|uniref:hypothetical protein n=1 Tax=Leptospira wolffii TaxID=409998 RepID=UPI0010830585|nr:hypothetical protein [Leptospira wolffii]TGK56231.1 hypothetical protein EHQ32_17640 [Leptospira wolffii]TGK72278.1 hypothetical protein EHQ35_13075 [Leptospira wolffii]TGK72816.1 hypothetical protein EHQ27_07005 [Leptospira wolffii]TGL27855.1 hypothetical protein EHQ57_15900 [Leptospira wolffii]
MKKNAKKNEMSGLGRFYLLSLLPFGLLLLSGSAFSQDHLAQGGAEPPKPAPEKPKSEEITIYEDQDGQLYTKPGPGRFKSKIDKAINKHDPKFNAYPNHLTNRPEEPQKERLTITGRVQFRGISAQTGSNYNNGNGDFNSVDWNFRRLRLGVQYQGGSWWGMALNLRGENMLNAPYITQSKNTTGEVTNVSLKEGRGYIQEAFLYVNIPIMGARVSFGQLPTQFHREYLMSSANFIALERSYMTNAYPQFDMGVNLRLSPLKDFFEGKYEKYLTVDLMAGNGHGAGGDYGTGRRQDLTVTGRPNQPVLNSPLYFARVQWNVLGGLVKENGSNVGWQEGEEIFQKDLKISLGAAAMQTKNVSFSSGPASTLAVDGAIPRGAPTQYLLTTQTTADNSTYDCAVPSYQTSYCQKNLDLRGYTYDGTMSWNGFYLSGAYTAYSGAASNSLSGWQATVGYNIQVFDKYWIMPVFRYDFLKGDFNRNGKIEDTDLKKYYWVGLNLFGDKHLFKAQLFYQIPVLKYGVDPVTREHETVNNQTVYFQLQATFWTGVVTPDQLNTRLD